MALDPIGELLARLTRTGEFPPKSERTAWAAAERGAAFAEGDRNRLARIAGWSGRRPYRIDPIADRIREAWADHLFGEDLAVSVENETDNDRLQRIAEENDLTEEVRHAVRDYQVPEGEAWWRIYVDRDVSDVPLLEWHSRASIAPYYLGRRLLAAALITVLEESPSGVKGVGRNTVYRLLECHEDERMVMALYRGTKGKLGVRRPLDEHPETEELGDVLAEIGDDLSEWRHDLPMLMGRIVNKRGRNPRQGRGEYEQIEDLLLKLNESLSISWANMRLTAKRRAVVGASAVNAPGSTLGGEGLIDNGDGSLVRVPAPAEFDALEDIIVSDPVNEELGKEAAEQFKVLEYSYDAEPLIADKRDTVETILTRLGLTPQWVGTVSDQGDGYAVSGTHYRLRMIVTDKAGRGRARAWDRELPRILSIMVRLDALAEQDGGLGEPWGDIDTEPTVERANPLPIDEVEQATTESTLVTAGIRSRETSVRKLNPDWDEDEVKAELTAIEGERQAPTTGAGF